jgi:hypothetical protein
MLLKKIFKNLSCGADARADFKKPLAPFKKQNEKQKGSFAV